MKILFVCASNVCRSPYCEYMFRRMVENDPDLNGKVTVKSSAVLNHMKEIDPKTREALIREGFDPAYVDAHVPGVWYRDKAKFQEADKIIGMTKFQKFLTPPRYRKKYLTLSEAATGSYKTIPDPWLIQDMDEYMEKMEVLKNYLEQFLQNLKQELL